jgi:transcription elongation factor GreA
MQTPKRKPGKYADQKQDLHITSEKFEELKNEFDKLKKFSQPKAIKETARLADMGDFSENFAYQHAKRTLRGINNRIDAIDFILKRAIIIKPKNSDRVELGHFVTVKINGKEKTFQILGSEESNPSKNIISHNSPIGSAIMNKKIGDVVEVQIGDKAVSCEIIGIK